jgi:ribosomal protein S27AE
MSAVLTRRRRSGRGRERDHRQPSLFSQVVAPPRPDESRAAVAAPAREPEAPVAEPADARVDASHTVSALASRTLDDAMSALWGELVTSETAGCPVCGESMQARHSAGAGVVGGRCGSCATTLA